MEKVIQNLECCVCASAAIIYNKTCPVCSAILCSDCLDSCIEFTKKKRPTSQSYCACPLCRAEITQDNWKHDKALQRVIDVIEVPCPWCDTEIAVASLNSHLSNSCQSIPLRCPYEGCDKDIPRKDMNSHDSDCDFRTIVCQCEKTILNKSLSTHVSNWCDFAQELEPLHLRSLEAIAIATDENNNNNINFVEKQVQISKLAADITRPLVIGVVGESNSGKTTLVNKLLNFDLLPAVPTLVPTLTRYSNKHEKVSLFSLSENNVENEVTIESFSKKEVHSHIAQGPVNILEKIQFVDAPGKVLVPKAEGTILVVDIKNINTDITKAIYNKLVTSYGVHSVFVFITKADTLEDLTPVKVIASNLFKEYEIVSAEPKFQFYKFCQQLIKKRVDQILPHLDQFYKELVPTMSPSSGANLVNELLLLVINGYDTLQLESAVSLAERYIEHYDNNVEDVVNGLIQYQMMFTGSTGFITGLGGIATMIVTLPSGLFATWYLGARLAASIAYVYGYDIQNETVQEVIILCLMYEEPIDQIRAKLSNLPRVNLSKPEITENASKEATRKAVMRMSRKVAMEVAKRKRSGGVVARKTGTKVVGKTIAEKTAKTLGVKLLGKIGYGSIQRMFPIISGAISGVMDMNYCRKVGNYANSVFTI